MRVVKPKSYIVYSFDELSEEAKNKALQELYNINIEHDWWEITSEDAKNIGVDIETFDLDRGSYCELNFLGSPLETAKKILKNHGESCETYKTAREYLTSIEALNKDYEDLKDSLSEDFKKSLSEDYRIILQNEYEYLTSEEAIKETIEANEYEFTEDGKLN